MVGVGDGGWDQRDAEGWGCGQRVALAMEGQVVIIVVVDMTRRLGGIWLSCSAPFQRVVSRGSLIRTKVCILWNECAMEQGMEELLEHCHRPGSGKLKAGHLVLEDKCGGYHIMSRVMSMCHPGNPWISDG